MEKIHYRAARVEAGGGGKASGDGHPLEEVGDFSFHELSRAIARCRSGEITDSKTEIALFRLADHLGFCLEVGLWRHELPVELQQRYRALGLGTNADRAALVKI
jgi:hypothetical protein